ncbi:sigma-70 family RNA polymerase sigma factor [Plantactinospora sp. KBS50]|uniref:sigma-70 family RNA polymerase sigma factor n=1 Tax=Plantactinospora sp. KBS50 TaxID=2024580 RepID=UPI000BAABD05|nr:sigma-70 family RNA polymerase sigma factor [Plantactinospora sp. KBS50]ASW54812.1 RNA polymerase subunit sigma [Plantactinospora sp. KBS50]
MTDDAQVTAWALAAGRGDRTAAAAFVRATRQSVWRFLAGLASPAEADDLTQETYLRAMRSLPSFAARSAARTWVLGIARRVAVDHVRASACRPHTVPMPAWTEITDRQHSGFDRRVALEQLIAGLPAEQRTAFVATQVLGMPYAEAARVCGCPVGTIRSRVARARADLVAAITTQPGTRGRRNGTATG